MKNTTHRIVFRADRNLCEIRAAIAGLKLEKGEEVMHAMCGIRIPLREVVAISGIVF